MAAPAAAQGFAPEPVFTVALAADRTPLVAGEPYRVAVIVRIDDGWHINTDQPGDDFSLPTEVSWSLPEGWTAPEISYPSGKQLRFEFQEAPINVWEGRVVLLASGTVPASASGQAALAATVTAQACNDSECLPPLDVTARNELEVAAAGATSTPAHQELFAESSATVEAAPTATNPTGAKTGGDVVARLASSSLILQLVLAFLFGILLNGTPCIFPLIPITVGFFSSQSEGRGKTVALAIAYVLGIAVTYSVLGTAAALAGQLFGGALQSPWVILVIVAVVLALAASMFGLWELRVPSSITTMSGGRAGVVGALIMGLVVGIVAAPCLGPFVAGLLTYVAQQGDPVLGFSLFFALSLGLGLPYLILGIFTGAIQKIPQSGMWMIGVKRFFGVILLALAVHFLDPLLPPGVAAWGIGLLLLVGGLYLLVVERTGHEQPTVDRVMRVLNTALIVAGLVFLPVGGGGGHAELSWQPYEQAAVAEAIASDQPVIIDFYADWCIPCKKLESKTFADPRVADVLAGYSRFKVDLTDDRSEAAQAIKDRYDVLGVPTVAVYDDGEELFRITGFEGPKRFRSRLP
jgi:thiol:disulfide interchange protein DsbD